MSAYEDTKKYRVRKRFLGLCYEGGCGETAATLFVFAVVNRNRKLRNGDALRCICKFCISTDSADEHS